MDKEKIKSHIGRYKSGAEKIMNGKVGKSQVSWSVLFFALGVVIAVVQILRSVFYFF